MIFQSVNKILMGEAKSNYRSDIDGLRAIACLSVVIYHAFPTTLVGGFTGVDIFFVISGFLISSILFRELENPHNPGKINIIDFYIRRIRRIFPALITVLITCLTLGYFVLLPDEYALLGKYTAGGAVYINNIVLYKETGNYFDVSSNAKPLLHLWSLGIEEQFYLVFPLILWLIYKSKLNFVFALTVFTLLSFFLNKNAVSHNNQTVAFYMPWCRFWELSIGAILAYIVEYHKVFVDKFKQFTKETLIKKICLRDSNIAIKDSTLNNILSIIGLLLIIMGILTVKQNLKFPGTKALIPVFGALFIIAAGKDSFINQKILSNKVMVFLGLISYPLYLWHWPLLSFVYICSGDTPNSWMKISAIFIAVILSIITYLIIEPPLRYGKHTLSKALSLLFILFCMGAFGFYIYDNKGFSHRVKFYENQKSFFENRNIDLDNFHVNFYAGRFSGNIKADEKFHYGHKKGIPQFLLIGDSHAWQHAPLIDSKVPFAMVLTNGLICGIEKCFSGKQIFYPKFRHKEFQSSALNAIAKNDINTIVIGHSYGENFDNNDIYEHYKNSIVELADMFKHKKFILIGEGYYVPHIIDCLFTKNFPIRKFFTKKKCNISYVSSNQHHTLISDFVLKEISSLRKNIYYIDPKEALCFNGLCRIYDEKGFPIFSDSNHLSVWGSLIVTPYILEKVNRIQTYMDR